MSKKILVVRYRFIGDMILTIPFLRNLRYRYPDAQIDMLVSPNSGEVIENCPYINNFIYFDTTRKHKYEKGEGDKKSFLHYVRILKKEKYDKAYILKRSLSSAILCFLSGIKERIGYNTEHRGIFLTTKVNYDRKKHESLCMLDVLEADGIEIKDTYLENWTNKVSEEKTKNLLKDINKTKVVVCATASNPNKVWELKNFKEIIQYLSNEKDVQVIYIGAPSDKKTYDNIKFNGELKNTPINLCGQLNLQDSLAILSNVDLIIGNDSGTLHMASSVGTTVIGLYGPMPFEKWKALGEKNILLKANLDCMPCALKGKCKNDHACLKSITVESVKQAIDKILNQNIEKTPL